MDGTKGRSARGIGGASGSARAITCGCALALALAGALASPAAAQGQVASVKRVFTITTTLTLATNSTTERFVTGCEANRLLLFTGRLNTRNGQFLLRVTSSTRSA